MLGTGWSRSGKNGNGNFSSVPSFQQIVPRVSRLVRYSDPRLYELFSAWPDR
jgi:hypothetical protein